MAKKKKYLPPGPSGPPPGYVEIFTPYIVRKDGTIVYPKTARVFHFYAKAS